MLYQFFTFGSKKEPDLFVRFSVGSLIPPCRTKASTKVNKTCDWGDDSVEVSTLHSKPLFLSQHGTGSSWVPRTRDVSLSTNVYSSVSLKMGGSSS